MKRPYLHLLVDALLALAGLSLVATGLLMEFVLPPRSGGAEVWGWDRHEWGQVHFWIAMEILVLLLVHLAFNWAWVCSVCTRLFGGAGKPLRRRRLVLGAASLIVVIAGVAGFLLAANASVVDDGRGHGEGRGWRGGHGEGWGQGWRHVQE